MKKDLRKILAALMALAMVCGAPLAMNGTFLGTAVSVGAEPLEDTSADIQQEASSEFMKYLIRDKGFDVQGLDTEGNDIQTTYQNYGFFTYLQVGDNEKVRAFNGSFMFGKVETIQGVELSITPSFTSNGKGVYITYSLYNGNEEAVDVKLGSCGDTAISGNDQNTVELTDGGVKMSTGDVTLHLIPGNANFTTTWVGCYLYGSMYYDHVFENGIGPGYSDGKDSAMCWSWSLHLEPGENKLLTALISVSEEVLTTYECTFDPVNGDEIVSTRVIEGEAAMKPNDPRKENSRFKFWSADGTTEYNFDTVLTGDTALTAVYEELTKTEVVQPDCGNDGNIAYWTAEDGTMYSDAYGTRQITAEETVIPATSHEWGEPSFEWSDDFSECTVHMVCTVDESHVYDETVKTTEEITKAPTTEEWGEAIYTAVFEADVEDQTVTAEIPPVEIPDEGGDGAPAPAFTAPRIGTGGVGTPEERAEENYTWSAKLDGGTIYWDSQPGADKYIISARRKGDTQWKRVGTTQDTEFDLSSMEKGTYTFLVRYVKGDFTAPARLSARTEAAVGSAKPVATAVSDEAGYVVLKWNAADGAEKYRVYRVQDGKLKKLGETAKCAVRVRGTSGDKFAVKAYINGKWTKVSKADLVTAK